MRLHLFEWMDQPWLPAVLRDAMRRYLGVAYVNLPVWNDWSALVGFVLRNAREARIVDLGSGAAGPVARVAAELRGQGTPVQVIATDLYPFDGDPTSGVRFYPEPVDARSVPASLTGVRTMFAAFHHLRPAHAAAVLQDAFARRQAICVFEATARTPAAIASSVFIPLLVLLLTPKAKPMRLSTLAFTYLVPVLPLLLFWDGLVSHLRTYSVRELEALTDGLTANDYQWTVGELHCAGIPFALPYLIGRGVRAGVAEAAASNHAEQRS